MNLSTLHELSQSKEDQGTSTPTDRKVNILLTGASFTTGNLGVNALGASMLKGLLEAAPQTELLWAGDKKDGDKIDRRISGERIVVPCIEHETSENYLWKRVLFRQMVYLLALRAVPFRSLRRRVIESSPYLRTIHESDAVVDITGGDSFADIYGFKRFVMATLTKLLVQAVGTDLVLLPQTLGPFEGTFARAVARSIMKNSRLVYSRDFSSLEVAKKLLGERFDPERFRFCHDMAFALAPQRPVDSSEAENLEQVVSQGKSLVGFNLSGLLFKGGYSKKNMFDLKIDYPEAVERIARRLLEKGNVSLVLVPHVFTHKRYLESDQAACEALYEKLKGDFGDRLILLEKVYDEGEIKYLIGQCEFFLGSRMHSCIAALSQCIPAVALAYSRKFSGLYETIGVASLVTDPRSMSLEEILEIVDRSFTERQAHQAQLEKKIPEAKENLRKMFHEVIRVAGRQD